MKCVLTTLSALLLAGPALTQETSQQQKSAPKQAKTPKKSEWIQLFNGKDLTGWIPKIRTYKVGENYADTFRVEDGMLKVRYDKYEGAFGERFGHLFHKKKFSHYILRVEYRFVGEQVPGGPGWAYRNSGLMLHGEDPRGMLKDQPFPSSIEVQLLGGNGEDDRTTSNLCTPGTNVVMDGKLVRRHCIKSKSRTYHGDRWVTAEVEVRGDKVIRHKIDGEVVLEYNEPQLDDKDEHAKRLLAKNGGKKLLQGGTISLQSESHPCDFRKGGNQDPEEVANHAPAWLPTIVERNECPVTKRVADRARPQILADVPGSDRWFPSDGLPRPLRD